VRVGTHSYGRYVPLLRCPNRLPALIHGRWLMIDGMVAGGRCLGGKQSSDHPRTDQETEMSIRTVFALSAVIVLSTAVTASAAPKKQKAPRSGPQAQAIAPRAAPPINPYSPAATGGGSPGYNQMLERY
jgi:hypothetical protein